MLPTYVYATFSPDSMFMQPFLRISVPLLLSSLVVLIRDITTPSVDRMHGILVCHPSPHCVSAPEVLTRALLTISQQLNYPRIHLSTYTIAITNIKFC